jgi:hypothetical protein
MLVTVPFARKGEVFTLPFAGRSPTVPAFGDRVYSQRRSPAQPEPKERGLQSACLQAGFGLGLHVAVLANAGREAE